MFRYIFKVGTRVINLHGICVFKFLTATLLKNLRRIRHCVPVICVNNYNRPTKSCARNISIFNTVIYFCNFIFPYSVLFHKAWNCRIVVVVCRFVLSIVQICFIKEKVQSESTNYNSTNLQLTFGNYQPKN